MTASFPPRSEKEITLVTEEWVKRNTRPILNVNYYIKAKYTPLTPEIPIGKVVLMFDSSISTEGFLLLNGQSVLKESYPDLYKIIGDLYTVRKYERPIFINKIRKAFPKLVKMGWLKPIDYLVVRSCPKDMFKIPNISNPSNPEIQTQKLLDSIKTNTRIF